MIALERRGGRGKRLTLKRKKQKVGLRSYRILCRIEELETSLKSVAKASGWGGATVQAVSTGRRLVSAAAYADIETALGLSPWPSPLIIKPNHLSPRRSSPK